MNILVIDDDKNILELTSLLLEKNGFEVTVTSDYASALKLFSETHFGVVLTKTTIGNSSCKELITQVVTAENGPAVVVMSGNYSGPRIPDNSLRW